MITEEFQDNSDPDISFPCDVPGCRSSFERLRQLEEHQRSQHDEQAISDIKEDLGSLSSAELRRAFTILATQRFTDFKICLFVDGLDEYIGNQQELLKLFNTVTKHPAIKAVLTSRPEPAFVEAFKDCPKLRVENLTSDDIEYYAKTMLMSHSKIRGFNARNSRLAMRLIDGVVSKACGVFLWVFLVVRLLLERLSDGIYPEELESLLEEYPEELHHLYDHMFTRMKSEHRLEAFWLFQAVLQAHEVESSIPSALRLSYLERNEASHSILKPVKVVSEDELHDRLSVFESRLRSRCCGLLEVRYETQHKSPEFQHWDEGQVEFIHRTVSDFLEVPAVRQILDQNALNTKDEIYESLLASLLYRFKSWDFFRLRTPYQWERYIRDIKSYLVYCQRCELHLSYRQSDCIIQLNKGLEQLWKIRNLETRSKSRGHAMARFDTHWAEIVLRKLRLKDNSKPDQEPLLALTAHFGLNMYVRDVLRDPSARSALFFEIDCPVLVTRLTRSAMRNTSLRERHTQLIEYFVEAGFNVNVEMPVTHSGGATTAWEDLVCLQTIENSAVEFEAWAELVQLFVRSGATINARLKHYKGAAKRPTARELIGSVLRESTIGKADLEELFIMEKGRKRIEGLLAESTAEVLHPRLEDSLSSADCDTGMVSPSTSLGDSNHRSPRPSHGNGRRKGQTQKELILTEPAAAPPAFTDPSRACSRCQGIDALKDAGLSVHEVLQVLDGEELSENISRLASKTSSTNSGPYQSTLSPSARTQVAAAKTGPPKVSASSIDRPEQSRTPS